MANTYVTHTGNGAANPVTSIPFKVFDATEVKVKVDNVEKTKDTDFSVATTGSIPNLTPAVTFLSGKFPASGASIYVYRKTDVTPVRHTYAAGSAIKASDLNNTFQQVIRVAEDNQEQPYQTSDIDDLAITTAKIAAEAVTTAKIADVNVTTAKIANSAVTDAKIAGMASSKLTGALPAIDGSNLTGLTVSDSAITSAKLHGDLLVTNSEQGSHTANDTSIYSSAASDARYFNIDSGEEIRSGETWTSDDAKIATTAAIDARIIDLVDDVGGFVAIANETSFPNANPDVNNGAGTIVSVKSLAGAVTSNGSGVATISNGTVGNSTVTINGLENSTTYAAGFGMLVETTTTLNTYTFHRQTPKATEVSTVAGKATEIGRLGTAAAVEDMGILGTTDCVADMAILGTTDVVADMALLGTSDCVSDMNTLGTSANVTAMDNCSGSISNINTVSGSIANVNTVGSNISTVNDFAARYRVASSAPGSDNDEGDLYFNTTSNELQVYNGSAWQGGVTATSGLVSTAGSTMTGDLVMDNQSDIRFEEATANGSNYIALQAPASIASNVTLTLPAADGSANQALLTDGSGTLSWGTTADATKMPLAGGNFTGDIQLNAQQEVRFADSDSSNYVGFKAPATVGTNVIWTLPTADGSNGQYLKTNGSGVLDWAADSTLTLIDEDDFSSDSATQPPSQQSTKAYIAATSQPLDADLTALAGCQTGAAAALALLTSTEVAVLDGVTATTAELNYCDGVTSNIQTQLNAKGAGDAVLANDQTWSGAQRGAITALSDGATVAIDFNSGNNFSLTLGGNRTLGQPSNQVAGQSGSIFITQDGTGSRTLAYHADWKWVGGTAPTLTTTAAAVDRIDYIVAATNKVHAVVSLDVK